MPFFGRLKPQRRQDRNLEQSHNMAIPSFDIPFGISTALNVVQPLSSIPGNPIIPPNPIIPGNPVFVETGTGVEIVGVLFETVT